MLAEYSLRKNGLTKGHLKADDDEEEDQYNEQ
jgi:hypothetical protein